MSRRTAVGWKLKHRTGTKEALLRILVGAGRVYNGTRSLRKDNLQALQLAGFNCERNGMVDCGYDGTLSKHRKLQIRAEKASFRSLCTSQCGEILCGGPNQSAGNFLEAHELQAKIFEGALPSVPRVALSSLCQSKDYPLLHRLYNTLFLLSQLYLMYALSDLPFADYMICESLCSLSTRLFTVA